MPGKSRESKSAAKADHCGFGEVGTRELSATSSTSRTRTGGSFLKGYWEQSTPLRQSKCTCRYLHFWRKRGFIWPRRASRYPLEGGLHPRSKRCPRSTIPLLVSSGKNLATSSFASFSPFAFAYMTFERSLCESQNWTNNLSRSNHSR